MTSDVLVVKNFAQIEEISLTFADLTVLVGPQGAGKSLALQWLKTALDGKQIVKALEDAGHSTAGPGVMVDLIFGIGMAAAWRADSEVRFNKTKIQLKTIAKLGGDKENALFIPAHRSMLIADGWAQPFQKLTAETPVVARMFSQNLFDRFNRREQGSLFPVERVLKAEYRKLINDAVFHGGTVAIEEDRQHAKRLKLKHGESELPFMTWTAGQREFTPLLLGLYHLLPPRKLLKQPEIDWVIIEEPEMGLHPKALNVFLLLALDLLWRGYRVVLSTHSPHVLTAVWMLQRLKDHHAHWQRICEAFGVPPSQAMQRVAEAALTKQYAVHLLDFNERGTVNSREISGLNPDADNDAEAGWGGLTDFSSRFGDAVRRAVNEDGQ